MNYIQDDSVDPPKPPQRSKVQNIDRVVNRDRLQYTKQTEITRGANHWNRLPLNAKSVSSLTIFKNDKINTKQQKVYRFAQYNHTGGFRVKIKQYNYIKVNFYLPTWPEK